MPVMSKPGRVAFLGDDLLLRSRVVAALDDIECVVVRVDEAPTATVDALFVDLNHAVAARVAAVAAWRAQLRDVTIVGFCSHGESEVRRQAMAAGADRVVTNGGVAAETRRLTTGGAVPPSEAGG